MACCELVTYDLIDLFVIFFDADKLLIFAALKIYWDLTASVVLPIVAYVATSVLPIVAHAATFVLPAFSPLILVAAAAAIAALLISSLQA